MNDTGTPVTNWPNQRRQENMKSHRTVLALALCALGASSAHADQTLSGAYAPGIYTFHDENITIDTVTLVYDDEIFAPEFVVLVYGGSIAVTGGGIDVSGAHGVQGQNGSYDPSGNPTFPSSGGMGADAAAVRLETHPSVGAVGPHDPSTHSISVQAPILASGGNGGNGGNGDGIQVQGDPCDHRAQHGAAGGRAGDGGAITLRAAGHIAITAVLDADGGTGGHGGNGASAYGPGATAGRGIEGSAGGAGGDILIEHTSAAASTSTLLVQDTTNASVRGSISATGGNGGNGGGSGDNDATPRRGGNGGHAGAGGSITIDCYDVTFQNFCNSISKVANAFTSGGHGGHGGNGGSAVGGWYSCDSGDQCIGGGNGAGGGLGGDGGSAGAISVNAASKITLDKAAFVAGGGNGGEPGASGDSTTGSDVLCLFACPGTLFGGTLGSEAGDGGDGSTISVTSGNLVVLDGTCALNVAAGLHVFGGDGGDAVDAGQPGTCCDVNLVQHYGSGGQGGHGGAGGNGGHINLLIVTGTFSAQNLFVCGGNGGDGGNGSTGQQTVGNPGLGGDGGASGSTSINGFGSAPGYCDGMDGATGLFGPAPTLHCDDP